MGHGGVATGLVDGLQQYLGLPGHRCALDGTPLLRGWCGLTRHRTARRDKLAHTENFGHEPQVLGSDHFKAIIVLGQKILAHRSGQLLHPIIG